MLEGLERVGGIIVKKVQDKGVKFGNRLAKQSYIIVTSYSYIKFDLHIQ